MMRSSSFYYIEEKKIIGEDGETVPGIKEVSYGEALIFSDLSDIF